MKSTTHFVPVPLTMPTTSAGQHHAPTSAGMLSNTVTKETKSDHRSLRVFATCDETSGFGCVGGSLFVSPSLDCGAGQYNLEGDVAVCDVATVTGPGASIDAAPTECSTSSGTPAEHTGERVCWSVNAHCAKYGEAIVDAGGAVLAGFYDPAATALRICFDDHNISALHTY